MNVILQTNIFHAIYTVPSINYLQLKKTMELRPLSHTNIQSVWKINEEGLPGTGQVSQIEISSLLNLSKLSMGVFQDDLLLGFVICLSPKTEYGSLNYAWFNQNYDSFIYVDRVAVAQSHRNSGIGSMLYEYVIQYSLENGVPVAAEVNLDPPNPGSMRFHHRFGFEEVGVLHHQSKSVTMLLRK